MVSVLSVLSFTNLERKSKAPTIPSDMQHLNIVQNKIIL